MSVADLGGFKSESSFNLHFLAMDLQIAVLAKFSEHAHNFKWAWLKLKPLLKVLDPPLLMQCGYVCGVVL